jgi:hypothetical protein
MPQTYKDSWVSELRSGKYTQGSGELMQSDGCYCCLGVLQACISGTVERYASHDDPEEHSLALPTYEWLREHRIRWLSKYGEDQPYPMLKWNDRWYSAYELNDHCHLSFNQIAVLIEEQIKGI